MRTVDAIRSRHLDTLGLALKRPGMFAPNAACIEVVLMRLIDDLRYIDERSLDWGKVIKHKYRLGCRGVGGQLHEQNCPFPDYRNEVASAYAEAACALGYFTPARLLPPEEMCRLRRAITPEFKARDWDERTLHARFGAPSHEVVGGDTTVACYACSKTRVKWVFFDLARRLPDREEWLDNPLLRDVRLGVRNRMYLSPLGRRWKKGMPI
jgi:hypothetical protein